MTDRKIDGLRAQQTLAGWSNYSGHVLMTSTEAGEGMAMALLQAEALAVTAGVRGFPTVGITSEGQWRMNDLGAARALIGSAREDVRTVYLATHGAVRLMFASARYPLPWEVPNVLSYVGGSEARGSLRGLGALGVLPAIPVGYLVLAGVGFAATVLGVSWWKTETDKETIRVNGDAARAAAAASAVTTLAQPYVAAGKPIPPELLEPLKVLATAERAAPIVPWVGAAVIVGGVVGAALDHQWGKRAS